VAVADLDQDGRLDLAVANNGANTVSVLLGHGDGTFAPRVDFATGEMPDGVRVGDLNGDGAPDLVVANYQVQFGGSVSVLPGRGDGTFAAETEYPTGWGPTTVALGDLNGDGKLDVVTSNTYGGGSPTIRWGTVRCCWGRGTGRWPRTWITPCRSTWGGWRSGT